MTLTVLRQAMGMAAQLVRFNKDGQKLAKAINLEKLFKDINEYVGRCALWPALARTWARANIRAASALPLHTPT